MAKNEPISKRWVNPTDQAFEKQEDVKVFYELEDESVSFASTRPGHQTQITMHGPSGTHTMVDPTGTYAMHVKGDIVENGLSGKISSVIGQQDAKSGATVRTQVAYGKYESIGHDSESFHGGKTAHAFMGDYNVACLANHYTGVKLNNKMHVAENQIEEVLGHQTTTIKKTITVASVQNGTYKSAAVFTTKGGPTAIHDADGDVIIG